MKRAPSAASDAAPLSLDKRSWFHVHICCLIALGSVSGQFRFAGRLDLIEPKSFALMRKFRCGMSIQMAYFQSRDFDRNCVAVVGVRRFGSQNRVYVVLGRFRCRFECRRFFESVLQELQYCGLVVVFSGDFEQIQARSIQFCVKYSGRHIGISHWAYTDSGEDEKRRFSEKRKVRKSIR